MTSGGGLPVAPSSVIPQGVGAPPPPGLDPKKGKLMCIKVRMLDDTVGVFHLGHKAVGRALFDEVCRHLNLLESDYFGLEFFDCYGNRCWLDYEKSILRQITSTRSDARFYFVVKFYTPNPEDLEEEYTRYLFALQVKRDLATGQLPCNDNTAALLASYIVQAECGDYSFEDYPDHTYLQSAKFVPKQDAEFEKKVMEHHKKHANMSPADADMALLETGRRCEMYGVKLHPAKDHEGTPLYLAGLHMGLKVYHQNLQCVNMFSWAKMRKMSFKKKRFLVKLHPDSHQYYKDTVEFYFETRNECKMFWKKCIEHHGFFRCSEVPSTPRQQTTFFSKGSSFRYCGRTQKQLIEYIREHHKRREPFTRPVHSSFSGGRSTGGYGARMAHSSHGTPAGGGPGVDSDTLGRLSARSLPTPILGPNGLPPSSSTHRLNGDGPFATTHTVADANHAQLKSGNNGYSANAYSQNRVVEGGGCVVIPVNVPGGQKPVRRGLVASSASTERILPIMSGGDQSSNVVRHNGGPGRMRPYAADEEEDEGAVTDSMVEDAHRLMHRHTLSGAAGPPTYSTDSIDLPHRHSLGSTGDPRAPGHPNVHYSRHAAYQGAMIDQPRPVLSPTYSRHSHGSYLVGSPSPPISHHTPLSMTTSGPGHLTAIGSGATPLPSRDHLQQRGSSPETPARNRLLRLQHSQPLHHQSIESASSVSGHVTFASTSSAGGSHHQLVYDNFHPSSGPPAGAAGPSSIASLASSFASGAGVTGPGQAVGSTHLSGPGLSTFRPSPIGGPAVTTIGGQKSIVPAALPHEATQSEREIPSLTLVSPLSARSTASSSGGLPSEVVGGRSPLHGSLLGMESGTLLDSKKRLPADKGYFIAKELLMSERTYFKDLTILAKHFKDFVTLRADGFPLSSLEGLFSSIAPLRDFHENLCMEIEQRVSAWENRCGSVASVENQRIGDIILCAVHNSLQIYQHYLAHLALLMANLDELYRTSPAFQLCYKEFESEKICYVPITSLVLKPPHRLLHYQLLLARLVAHYSELGGAQPDLSNCRVALEKLTVLNSGSRDSVQSLENFVKLIELERDFSGVDSLVQPNRRFIMEGSLQRYSKKGSVQRMFFLLNDCLLYANRSSAVASGSGGSGGGLMLFKIHGQIPLRGLMLEDGDPFKVSSGLQHCFTIYGGNRSLVIAASSADEKRVWVESISKAVMIAKENAASLPQSLTTLRSCSSTDEVDKRIVYASGESPRTPYQDSGKVDSEFDGAPPRSPSAERQLYQRANNTTHVCWHRGTSLTMEDIHRSSKNNLSGYLLRKFRNSVGWQKLWVVHAGFCLFFYRSHQEDIPLASLPLLGYQVSSPAVEDAISKSHVFKLHYKTHYYFFRAESEYTFSRWFEALRCACGQSVVPPPSTIQVEPLAAGTR